MILTCLSARACPACRESHEDVLTPRVRPACAGKRIFRGRNGDCEMGGIANRLGALMRVSLLLGATIVIAGRMLLAAPEMAHAAAKVGQTAMRGAGDSGAQGDAKKSLE